MFNPKETETTKALFAAQDGLCALCGKPMLKGDKLLGNKPLGFTKEHVFPRAYFPGLIHQIVLTHYKCNNARGEAFPMPCLIIYAISIYLKLGLDPFILSRDPGKKLNYENFEKKYKISQIKGK